jgi:rubrerythrin
MPQKPQDLVCRACGHRWIGTSSVCPQCNGIAKSEGEMTRKTFDESDLKKSF